VGSLDSKEKVRLLTGMSMAAYAEPGYLLFHREGSLLARPFDAERLAFTGEPVRIADNIVTASEIDWAAFGASGNGAMIYRSGARQAKSQLQWLDRNGNRLESALELTGYYPIINLSPDGRKIATYTTEPASLNYDIWLIDWDRNVRTRFTYDSAVETMPIWSPDGSRIAFTSFRKGTAGLYEKSAGGTSNEITLLDTPVNEWIQAWSKDGQYIAYRKETETDSGDIHILPLFGERKPFPFVQSAGVQSNLDFSYDGRWLAYSSNESGIYEVYLISFPKAEHKHQISNSGGIQPKWRRDGKEIYYMTLDGKLMAADITTESGFHAKAPRMLFDTAIHLLPEWYNNYAVTPDGQRFLVLRPFTEETSAPITIVLNWTLLPKK
jgi:Tol biopolymer transport system component